MADFDRALPYVLKHEGGFVNDPDDPGGATNKGITLETAQRHGISTVADLQAITDEKVAEIYRADYWQFDGIESQSVATKLFDMGVNFGTKTAVKLCQEALNEVGASLRLDGVCGPQTLGFINATLPAQMLEMLCHAATGRYLDIVIARPKSKKYLNGWMARANEVPQRENV